MIRSVSFLLIFFASCQFAWASHDVSLRIEWNFLGNDRFLIRIISLSDPSAALVDRCEMPLEVRNCSGDSLLFTLNNIKRINGPIGTDAKFPVATCPNTGMGEYLVGDPNFPTALTNIKRNIYEDTLTLPGMACYQFRTWDVSRIDNMVNMTSSGSQSNFAAATLEYTANFSSYDSPVIGADSNLYACVGSPWLNESNISDPNGDSLVYKTIPAQQYDPPMIPVPIPASGFSSPHLFGSSGPFYVGGFGEIYWNSPGNQGAFAYSLRIQSYQNGLLQTQQIWDQSVFVGTFNCLVGRSEAMAGQTEVLVFPNPCSRYLNVRPVSQVPYTLAIRDLNGRKLGHWQENRGALRLELAEYPQGLYFLEYSNEFGRKIEKIHITR